MEKTLIVALIRGSMQAISFWQNQRDRIKAKKVLKNINKISSQKDVLIETEKLLRLAPKRIINSLTNRVQTCFDRYEFVLNDNKYLPEEIDKATDALIECICRELNRLLKVNGGTFPTKTLNEYWVKYNCKIK